MFSHEPCLEKNDTRGLKAPNRDPGRPTNACQALPKGRQLTNTVERAKLTPFEELLQLRMGSKP